MFLNLIMNKLKKKIEDAKLKKENARKNNWWVKNFKILQFKEEYDYFKKLKEEKKKKDE